MHHYHNTSSQQSKGDGSSLPILKAVILRGDSSIVEYLGHITEIDSVLADIRSASLHPM
jgi:hypothetical protein